MGKHLIVAGHGGSDPGAVGNGTNERDFTRKYYVDQIAEYINATSGHSAVVYDKRQNMYLDTYNGGGMYWAKKQGFDTVTEIHQDAATQTATGGHVIVFSGFVPDAIDLAMRDTIQKYVGIRYTHKGHKGISGRNNLLQVNVGAELGVNYRLVDEALDLYDIQNIRVPLDIIEDISYLEFKNVDEVVRTIEAHRINWKFENQKKLIRR